MGFPYSGSPRPRASRCDPLAAVAIVVLVYLPGKVIYRLRDVLLVMVVAGFVAIVLNPVMMTLQHWAIKGRDGRSLW